MQAEIEHSRPSQTQEPRLRHGFAASFGRFLLPIGFFLIVTIIMTYPLVTDLTHGIVRHPVISRSVDVDTERWAFWWFKTSLAEQHRNPFYTDMLYYPYRQADNPLPLYYNDNHPLDMIIGMPIVLANDSVVGPTLAYNLLAIGHLVFAGCAMFWLVRYLLSYEGYVAGEWLGGAPDERQGYIAGKAGLVGALVAGVLFAFSALNQYQLDAGHLVLLATGWMLLHLLFLHKLLYAPRGQEEAAGNGGQRKRDIVNGGLAALFLLATSFTNWYLTAFLLTLAVLMTLVRVGERPRDWRVTAVRAGAVMLVWVVAVSPFLLATIKNISDSTSALVSGLDYEVTLSLSPLELLTVSKDNRVNPALWWPGTLGYSALLLGGIGVIAARRMRRSTLFWIVLIGAGVVLSLGPYLKWDPEVREVSGTTGVPLPYLLFRNLPFMSIARAPRRFVLLADIGLSVLAGFGVSYLLSSVSRFSSRMAERRSQVKRTLGALPFRAAPWLASAALIIVPMLELQTLPQPLSKVAASPFLVQLGADTRDYAILELPVTSHYARDHDRMFSQTLHHKKIIGGYLSRPVYDYYSDASSPFRSIVQLSVENGPDIVPPMSPFAVCNYYNIPYVIQYKQSISYERPEDRKRVEDYLHKVFPDPSSVVYEDEQLVAYRVPQARQTGPLVWVGDGWYPPEMEKGKDGGPPSHVWRWSKGRSELYISSLKPVQARLQFASNTLSGDADLDIAVNGKSVQQARLTPQAQVIDVKLELPTGQSRVTFSSNARPVTPIEAGISTQDDRELSFVVADMKIDY